MPNWPCAKLCTAGAGLNHLPCHLLSMKQKHGPNTSKDLPTPDIANIPNFQQVLTQSSAARLRHLSKSRVHAANNMLLFAYALKAPSRATMPRIAMVLSLPRSEPVGCPSCKATFQPYSCRGRTRSLIQSGNMLSSKLSSPPLRCQKDSLENISKSVSQHPDK